MSEQKIIIQQLQSGGVYTEFWPKTDGWTKVQTISDLTKTLLGLSSSATPDDAFLALSIGKDSKAYRVKVTYPNGQPAVGFTVGGLTAFPAVGLVTDSTGTAIGTSTSTTPTITVAQKYSDVKSYSKSFTSTRLITECNVVLSWNVTTQKVASSTTLKLSVSPYISRLYYLLVGAGGSATRGDSVVPNGGLHYGGASGGAGGNYVLGNTTVVNGDSIQFVIGQGASGQAGGSTTISRNNSLLNTAKGGNKRGSSSLSYNPAWKGQVYQNYTLTLTGGSRGVGNGNGGKGGDCQVSSRYMDDDGWKWDSGTCLYVKDGENRTVGATVSFGGLSIRTGGGGAGGGAYHDESGSKYDKFANNGTDAASDVGGGGSILTGSDGRSPMNGGAWYYFSH